MIEKDSSEQNSVNIIFNKAAYYFNELKQKIE